MLKNVLILWSYGNLLFSKSYGFVEKDPTILSGLLSAFSNFAKELGEKEIRAIHMHPHKIFMSIRQEVLFTIFLDEADEDEQGKLILKKMIDAFLAIYGNTLDPNKSHDLAIFYDFENILDELNIVKNVYEIVQSANNLISLPEVRKEYADLFKSSISASECWKSLDILVKENVIVEVSENLRILYRKKGDLLKGFELKFKK
ncbi:MAG TPA: hypothetical protein VMV49_02905 [Candidatus Deferrimicrobium sp.]|nr:hypothetical protein [Candidatus Deferrimicrobium sp.]